MIVTMDGVWEVGEKFKDIKLEVIVKTVSVQDKKTEYNHLTI